MFKLDIAFGESLRVKKQDNQVLIDGVLWGGDVMMLLGSEKAGKSILAMQMAHALTSGQVFLDKYKVPAKVPIVYLQTEGKKSDFIDRMNAMSETLECDDNSFFHFYYKFFPLDIDEFRQEFVRQINALPIKPIVGFIDSLYTSMIGDLIDNKDVRILISALAWIIEQTEMTLVIVHHDRKEEFVDGKPVHYGDKSSYGSVFLRAWVDHILYLKKERNKIRSLSCDTQRSGKVLEKEELILVEPSPLCFEIKQDQTVSQEILLKNIQKGSKTRKELITLGLSESTVDRGIRHLLKAKLISCLKEGRELTFTLNHAYKESLSSQV